MNTVPPSAKETRQIDALIGCLDEIEDYLARHEDVRDGDDGPPRPNEAMSLLQDLRWWRDYGIAALRAAPSHERPLDRGDAVNLAWNLHATGYEKLPTAKGVATLVKGVLDMDAELARIYKQANEQQRNEILSAPTSPQGPLELTPAEVGIHDPAPEREGEIAARESLEPEGAGQCHRQRTASLADAQNGLTGRRDAHPSSTAARGAVIPFDLLDEIEDYFEQRQDVRDGSDGPRPNREMHLYQRLRDEAYSAKPSAIGERK